MKAGDLVKRVVNLGEYATAEELERFNRLGVIVDTYHEPFSTQNGGPLLWYVMWQDGEISSGHWSDDLEVIRESR